MSPVKGRRNPMYNGGLSTNADGRAIIICRDERKVYFYRAVMEAHLGRHLRDDEHIHHINGDRTDDRLENLEILSASEHGRRHRWEVCRQGHPLSAENLYVSPRGKRECLTCKLRRRAEARAA